MAEMLGQAVDQFALYWLVLARVAGIFFVIPIFGHRSVPAPVRVGLTFLVSLTILPLLPPQPNGVRLGTPGAAPPGGVPDQMLPYAVLVVREIAFGLATGFVVVLVFAVVEMAGQMLDVEMGFSLVNVIDPVFGHPLPVIGNLLHLLALLLFLLVDGHHVVLAALVESFRQVPPGVGGLGDAGLRIGLEQASWVFYTAVKIAAPMMGVLFVTSVVLGLLARAAPQLNIFIVGLPVKVAVGLVSLAAAMPVTILAMRALFPHAYRQMVLLFQTVGAP